MAGRPWTRDEVLVAFNLYCRTPFGRLHARNPEIVSVAAALGRSPGSLAMKCCNLAAFDPVLRERGIAGLRKAAAVDREVWKAFHEHPEETGFESETKYSKAVGTSIRVAEHLEWRDVEGLDTLSLTKVRVNQQLFREIILASYATRCAVCSLPIARLLVASHIVPWAIDKSNRMNPRNGICLCALHDRAYDRGVLDVDETYTVRISPEIQSQAKDSAVQQHLLSYHGARIQLPERWPPEPRFLKMHGTIIAFGCGT